MSVKVMHHSIFIAVFVFHSYQFQGGGISGILFQDYELQDSNEGSLILLMPADID